MIADDGNNRNLEDVRGSVNITMDGDGTQRLYSALKNNTEIKGSQLGTYTVKRGRLFMDNSRIASTHRLAVLVMEGGEFGAAHYNSTNIGTAYFKSGEISGGGFAFENFENHNALELLMSDKIVFSESLAKSAGSGKIGINFTGGDGNALDLANYGYIVAEGAESIENWIEILTAGELSGFDLESKLGENIYERKRRLLCDRRRKRSRNIPLGGIPRQRIFPASGLRPSPRTRRRRRLPRRARARCCRDAQGEIVLI